MKPDLHVVSETARPLISPVGVETFTFIRSDKATVVFRNGRLIDDRTAVDEITALFEESFKKREQLFNEIASTPGGLL